MNTKEFLSNKDNIDKFFLYIKNGMNAKCISKKLNISLHILFNLCKILKTRIPHWYEKEHKHMTDEFLFNEYITKNKTVKQICRENNCSTSPIDIRLRKIFIDGKDLVSYKKPIIKYGFWHKIQRSAKKRGILFNLERERVWNLFIKQNRKCALSGLELKFDSKYNIRDGSVSLDRIDSNGNYTLDNVWIVNKEINIMKWDLSLNRFLMLVKLIFENKYNNSTEYKEISTNFSYLSNIKYIAKEKCLEFNLDNEFLINLFNKQCGKCIYSGINLNLNKTDKLERTASLDRIDSSKGYIKGNVQWVHKDVNKMKMEHSEEKFLKWIEIIYKYNNLDKLIV